MRSKEFLTCGEVAELLRVSPRTVLRYLERGHLRAKRINRRWFLYYADSVVQFLNDRPDYRPDAA